MNSKLSSVTAILESNHQMEPVDLQSMDYTQSEKTRDDDAPGETPDSETNEVAAALRTKRRRRSQKVCQPCRLRKVKCTYEIPCQSCVERGHAELCSYAPQPQQKRAHERRTSPQAPPTNAGAAHWLPSKQEWDEMCDSLSTVSRLLRDLQDQVGKTTTEPGSHGRARSRTSPDASSTGGTLDPSIVEGISAKNALTGDTVYLGGNSVPAMVAALAHDNKDGAVQDLLHRSILPVFALDNESATYPFVDLWGLPHGSFLRIELLCKLLPSSDSECMQVFKQFRDTAHIIYPGVIDILQFESDLLDFLRNRSSMELTVQVGSLASQMVFGKSLHWLGLLFATLASGFQCSDLSRKERQMKSQVYVACAYECLRIVNYLSRATLVDLQNLLVLGNVLSNNMNAGVAWSLLGLTIRLAQSLGIHAEPPSSDPSLIQTIESKIWWQIIWQDSLLSITFDRTSPTTIITQRQHAQATGKLSYVDTMKRLCKIGLEIVQQRAISLPLHRQLSHIVECRDQIQEDFEQMEDHLTDITKCRLMKDYLEFWNLSMHRSYILSELCRPTIRAQSYRKEHRDLALSLRALCIQNLTETVEAFLGFQNISKFACQSWAAVHRSLSSALLLGILGEATRSGHVQGLLSRLTAVMLELISGVDPNELSEPLVRSVTALQRFVQRTTGEVSESSSSTTSGIGALSSLSASPDGPLPYDIVNSIFWGSP